MEQEQDRASLMAEKRLWTQWSLLIGVAVMTTLGLATAMAALLNGQEIVMWPWAKTAHVLLIGISLFVVIVAVYLTRMQKRVTETHKRYLLLQGQIALQHSEFRFNAVLNTVGEGIVTVNSALVIVMANREASRIWGRPRSELMGMSILDLIDNGEPGPSLEEIVRVCESDENSVSGRRYQLTGLRSSTRFPLEFSITGTELEGVQHFTLAVRDISERVRAQERIRDLAFYDSLTGLPNRQFFGVTLQNAIDSAARRKRGVALLFLDLDGFKRINDTLGHSAGDQLLGVVAKRLRACVRSGDAVSRLGRSDDLGTISRLGGDGFTILLTGMTRAEDAAKVCQRVQRVFSEPIRLKEREVVVSTSIGIAVYPTNGDDAETLLKHADAAMYSAKARGPNHYDFFVESLNANAERRLSLEGRLHGALGREEFAVSYQPVHDTINNKLVGAEALVHWVDPELGEVGPGEFIPIAEDTGVVAPIGEWAIRTACRQASAWQRAGSEPFRVVVSLSAHQFQGGNLFDTVKRILGETGLPETSLEFGITERTLLREDKQTLETVRKLAEAGMKFVLDDFGISHSSLLCLKRFPISRLRIDSSFVSTCTTDPQQARLTSAIITFARSNGLKVLAAGVETTEQAEFLRKNGCDEYQRNLCGRPMPAEEFGRFLDTVHVSDSGRF